MDVVSEGVDTEYEQVALKNLNSGYSQGYYFSKPVPLEAFKLLLK